MTGLIDPRHVAFLLDDVLEAGRLFALPAFAHNDAASAAAMLETARKLAANAFLPSHGLLDANEPVLENGKVRLPREIEAALEAYREAGFCAITADPAVGGIGLPRTYANAAFLWFQAANVAIANYAMLTASAAELLAHHATPEQKARYLTPMLEGRFHGTMALSEPHAGSSLGDLTTRARPRRDNLYALSGTKMWISGGEHDMGENIVHLMLARIEGAPPGAKGISLFIVPRKRLDAAGRPAEWNNIALSGLNHKMGQRGTVNTILNIGEGGETLGEIVGQPGGGLAAMFTMMNEARIGVAMGAVAHASAAYRHALAYARVRRQGRHPDARDPASPQIPLVEHADVRRMLLQQKAATEGGMALALFLAKLADLKKAAPSPVEREEAGLLLDFLTPVFKAWISEECLAANVNAIQVLGGAGYTRDHPVEQHYRDNRLNPIHEGTNGIQAMDLLGRKAGMAHGRALALFLDEVRGACARQNAASTERTMAISRRVRDLAGLVIEADRALRAIRLHEGAGAHLAFASDFMELVGATAFAWIWLVQARAAERKQARPDCVCDGYWDGLVATAYFVMEHVVPRAVAAADRIRRGGDGSLSTTDAMFG